MSNASPIRVQIRSDARKVYVTAIVLLAGGGDLKFTMEGDRSVFERVLRSRAEAAGVGFSFGDILKGAKKLAKLSAVRKALSVAKSVVNTPLLGDLIPPTVRAAINATSRATEAAAALRSDNPQERQQAASIIERARAVAPQQPHIARALNLAASLTGAPQCRCPHPGAPPALPAATQQERPY